MAIELPRRRMPSEYVVGKDAVRLVSPFEGLSLKAYPDPASQRSKTGAGPGDPWTIGYGRAHGVREGDTCTLFQADQWLMEDLNSAANIVKAQITVPLTPGEFTALVSLVFNLGYIPRSLKACLNGGTTDRGEVMPPGSYGSALKQFVRNCRAAGIPMRGLLRRRLAECCVYSDLPWEAACSLNLISLKCDAKGNIDPIETTSLEDTLMRARQDVPILRPDVSDTMRSPWPTATTVIVDAIPDWLGGIPVQLPIPDAIEEDELLLDTPAATALEPEAKGTAPESATQPTPARVPQVNESAKTSQDAFIASKIPPSLNTNPAPVSGKADEPNTAAPRTSATAHPPVPSAPFGGPSGVVVEARPVPAAPPPIVRPPPPKLPDPPIPVGQQTSAVDATRKAEDWSESAKSMIFSRRFWGLFLVVVGRLWMLKTGSNAVLGAVSDPIVTEMFSGFMVMMLGEVVQRIGERKATRPLK